MAPRGLKMRAFSNVSGLALPLGWPQSLVQSASLSHTFLARSPFQFGHTCGSATPLGSASAAPGAAPPLGFPWKLVVPQPLMLTSRGMKHDQLGPQSWLPSEARAPDGCCSSALPTLHFPPGWVSIRWEKLPAGLRDYINIPFPVLSGVVVDAPGTQRGEMVS